MILIMLFSLMPFAYATEEGGGGGGGSVSESPEQYTVSFDRNGGTGTAPSDIVCDKNSSITLPTGDGLEKAGYSFAGWNDGNGTLVAGSSYTPSRSITLAAVWNATPSIFTVSFAAGEGATGTVPSAITQTAAHEAITLPSKGDLVKTDCNFQGWTDGTNTYAAGNPYTPLSNITLTASWSAQQIRHTVSFDINQGTGTVPSPIKQETQGQAITLPTSGGFSKAGSVFQGWSDGSSTRIGGSEYTPSADVTLVAQWVESTAKYTVSFNINGGTGTAPTQIEQSAVGAAVTLPAVSGFSKSGFVCTGWTDGVGKYAPGAGYTPASNIQLCAVWEPVFTITFMPMNGGSSTTDTTDISGKLQSLPTPTWAGNIFNGWYSQASGGTQIKANETVFNSNATVYAQWIPEYIVTFNPNGGSCSTGTATTGADKKLSSLPTPTRSGFKFTGWYTAASGGTQIKANETVFNESTTVYAHWTAAETIKVYLSYTSGGYATISYGGNTSSSYLEIPYGESVVVTANAVNSSSSYGNFVYDIWVYGGQKAVYGNAYTSVVYTTQGATNSPMYIKVRFGNRYGNPYTGDAGIWQYVVAALSSAGLGTGIVIGSKKKRK